MDKDGINNLTSVPQSGIMPTFKDAFGKLSLRVRWSARHLEHGKIELTAILQVVNGEITQCDSKIEPFERFRANNIS